MFRNSIPKRKDGRANQQEIRKKHVVDSEVDSEVDSRGDKDTREVVVKTRVRFDCAELLREN